MRWWLVSTENPCTSRSVKHRNSQFIETLFDKQMVPKNPGPGLLHQAPTFVPEIGPAIKQFPGPSVA